MNDIESIIILLTLGIIVLTTICVLVLRDMRCKQKEVIKCHNCNSEKILTILDREEHTVSSLCNELNIEDEHEVVKIIGDLENSGKVSLKGFKKVYREDGGEIHLAIYGSSK